MTGPRLKTDRPVPLRPMIIGGLVLLSALLHLITDPSAHQLHDFYFKITYLQIALAAVWYGKRGGLIVSSLTSLVYLWHINYQLIPHGEHHRTALLYDIVLYNLFALLVGALADRQEASRRRLSKAKDDLEVSFSKLRQQASALLKAETELRESHRLKVAGQLAAEFAHEVRNPLGGILGAGEILGRDGVAPSIRREFSVVLRREIRRLDGVVNNYLNLARRHGPQLKGTTFEASLQSVKTLLRRQLDSQVVTLTVDDQTGGVVMGIGSEQSSQVFLNLVLNALDVLPEGGSIRATAIRDGEYVVIHVKDSGPGIPGDLRDRVFEPFVSGRTGGSGLGLAIVRRLLEESGGKIKLMDDGGRGADFVLRIPLQDSTGTRREEEETA